MDRNHVFSVIIISTLILSLVPVSINQIPLKSSQNNINHTLNENTYKPGTYMVPNDKTTTNMKIIQELQTIEYSIISIDTIVHSRDLWYQNQRLEYNFDFNIGEPSVEYQDDMDISSVWDQGYNGTGIVIGIIDTGINFEEPALQGKKVLEKSFHKKEYGFSSDQGPSDNHGHGTAVASAAVGIDEGELKSPGHGAKLVNAKIGIEGGFSTTLSVAAAMDWVINLPDVDIVSMSLSEPEEGFSFDPLEKIMNEGVKTGKIILSSAGNTGSSNRDYYQIGSPSSAPEVISVGATDHNSDLAYFSSEGPTYGLEAKPDILAKGTAVKVSDNNGDYKTLSGTSFSTPLVAGAVASLLEAAKSNTISLTPGKMKALIGRTANDIGLTHYQQGFGEMNASRALKSLLTLNLAPVIGPNPNHIQNIELPLETSVLKPISLIGFEDSNITIVSQTNGIEVTTNNRYIGNTSIMELNLILTSNLNQTNVRLNVTYLNSTSQKSWLNYTLPITTLPKPNYTVLLDLKHTLFDTIQTNSNSENIERIEGRDIKDTVTTIRQHGGWVTEFLGKELTIDILNNYDILWMPSAFMEASPIPYDHQFLANRMNRSEMFSIFQYLQNGGNLLIDFGGVSIFDDDFNFSIHQYSLERLEHIIGIEIQKHEDSLDWYPSISSDINNKLVSLPTGKYELNNGIPMVEGMHNYSALAKFTDNGGGAYIQNARSWRLPHYASDSDIKQYLNNILSWLHNYNNITDIELKSGKIIIDSNIFTEDDNILFKVNGQEISVSKTVTDTHLIIEGYFNPGDRVTFDISENNKLKFNLDDVIPSVNKPTNSIQASIVDDKLEIAISVNDELVTSSTLELHYNGRPVAANYFQVNDEITITHFIDNTTDVKIDDFEIAYLDKFGRMGSLDISTNHITSEISSQDTVQTTNTDNQVSPFFLQIKNNIAIIVAITSQLLFVIAIVYFKKK